MSDACRSRGREKRRTVATDGRDEHIEREPLDRGPSPHVSCQAKARVPICAPKDRFTRVLAASFTGAPRYTREVFILGSRSSPFSSPSVADTLCPKSKKKPEKTQTPRDPRRRHGVKPVLLGGRRSRFVVWYAHRLSLLTNSLECCRHGKGRAAAPRRRARLSFVIPGSYGFFRVENEKPTYESPRRFQASPHRNEDSKSPFPDGPV